MQEFRARTAVLCAALICLLSACGSQKTNNAANTGNYPQRGPQTGSMGQAAVPSNLNCGATQAVWVNLRTHVYHEPGDPYYGRTKNGQYMCPSQAVSQGDRPSGQRSSSDAGGTGSNGTYNNDQSGNTMGNGSSTPTETGSRHRHRKRRSSSY